MNTELEISKERANELYNELESLKEKYNLRRCTKCGLHKSIDTEFGKGKRETMCIPCRREYNRNKYNNLVQKAKAYDENK